MFFGSSVLALLACAGGEAQIDLAGLQFYWARAFVSADSSLIKGAHPVAPGTVLELDWQGREISTARCEPAVKLVYAGGSEDVHGTIGGLLAASMDRRLENNPHPVALLSGGIDLTVVTKVMLERVGELQAAKEVKVLTLGSLIP